MFCKQGKPASIGPEISIVTWKEHKYNICICNNQNEKKLYKEKHMSVTGKSLGFGIINKAVKMKACLF